MYYKSCQTVLKLSDSFEIAKSFLILTKRH